MGQVNEPRYLDMAGCAAFLGRTVEAVRTMTKRGKLPHIKIDRRVQFDREKLERFMERHSRRAAGTVIGGK